MRDLIRKTKDKMKNKDFKTLIDLFSELNKELEKAKKITEKEGVPIFYIRIMLILENFLTNFPKED